MIPESKRLTHREALVFLLRDGEWHGMWAMIGAGGPRFGARLNELRKAGFVIETKRVGPDVFEYRWLRTPGQIRLI